MKSSTAIKGTSYLVRNTCGCNLYFPSDFKLAPDELCLINTEPKNILNILQQQIPNYLQQQLTRFSIQNFP